MCPGGNPASLKPPEKPRPCSKPEQKATTHGARAVIPSTPRCWRVISAAANAMLSAITALTAAQPVAALPPGQRDHQAQQGAGFRDGDQFVVGRETSGSGIEAGAGAAVEGDVREGERSPQKTTGDGKLIRAAAGADITGPVPNLNRQT